MNPNHKHMDIDFIYAVNVEETARKVNLWLGNGAEEEKDKD